MAIANPVTIEDWSGQIGVPIPSTDAAILDDDGKPVALGQVGEICLRGPQVMKGYWKRPEETAKVFTADGWLRTGDMGVMDERGRYPPYRPQEGHDRGVRLQGVPERDRGRADVHPGVLEVAAIGVPDERSGEAVKVVVVRKDPALTRERAARALPQHLTGYKMPRIVEFRSEPLAEDQHRQDPAARTARQLRPGADS